MPPLAMPGLPVGDDRDPAVGRRDHRARALQHRDHAVLRREPRAAATRSACTSAGRTPSSRAISPGCGVTTVGPGRSRRSAGAGDAR